MISAMVLKGCEQSGIRQVTSIVWSDAGSLPAGSDDAPHPGLAGAVAGIHNDMLIVGGGANFPDAMPWHGGKKQYHDALYLFRKRSGVYEPVEEHSAVLPFPVAYGASCSTSEGVVYAGGENANGLVNTVLCLRSRHDSGEVVIDRLPDLPYAVANAAIAEAGGTVYLAGGETIDGVSDKLLSLDLHQPGGGWCVVTVLPHAVSHAILVATGEGDQKHLYLMGGRRKVEGGPSDFFASNFELDLQTKDWRERAPLPYGLSAGTGCSTGSEVVLLGGDRGETFRATEELLVSISNEKDLSRKDSLTRQKNLLQEGHPGFSREVLKYSTTEDTWSVIGEIPSDTPVTTAAIMLSNSDILIPGGEIRAGVRTPDFLHATLVVD